MRISVCLALAAWAVPGAAFGSSMVFGSGNARMCFEAAEAKRATPVTLDLCNRAISEEPLSFGDQVATYVNRGILRARLKDLRGAIADYDRAIGLDPAEPEAYLNKAALVLRIVKDPQQARDLFDAAIARGTRRPELAYYGRAVAQEIAGNLPGAYADYRKAAELAPGWDEPRKELARFSVRKKG